MVLHTLWYVLCYSYRYRVENKMYKKISLYSCTLTCTHVPYIIVHHHIIIQISHLHVNVHLRKVYVCVHVPTCNRTCAAVYPGTHSSFRWYIHEIFVSTPRPSKVQGNTCISPTLHQYVHHKISGIHFTHSFQHFKHVFNTASIHM